MKGSEYENASEARTAGLLPDASNTIQNEAALPPWVREARKELRAQKAAEVAKANGK